MPVPVACGCGRLTPEVSPEVNEIDQRSRHPSVRLLQDRPLATAQARRGPPVSSTWSRSPATHSGPPLPHETAIASFVMDSATSENIDRAISHVDQSTAAQAQSNIVIHVDEKAAMAHVLQSMSPPDY
ncbi:hypothetical protein MPH_10313 [Macrophomina phaseolina MS6]|uniref:Uncharacterized protein n=1 Tax=Macrophomina phaseolina (strain MS6) TaxID=1126212 RepID=K2RDE4_MACPH|nr:hypothetical protein MPH_10313 [Macrophomina phaseolina MS6]